MRGGEGPARIKKTQYIYSFLTAEKDVQVARNGGRGGRGYSGNARKKAFFFEGGVTLFWQSILLKPSCHFIPVHMLSIGLPETVVSTVDPLLQHLHHIWTFVNINILQVNVKTCLPYLQHCRTQPLPKSPPPSHFGPDEPAKNHCKKFQFKRPTLPWRRKFRIGLKYWGSRSIKNAPLSSWNKDLW